jgi:hypothetical protein
MSRYRMITVPPEKDTSWQVVYGNIVEPGTVLAEAKNPKEADDLCIRLAMSFRVPALTFWPQESPKPTKGK